MRAGQFGSGALAVGLGLVGALAGWFAPAERDGGAKRAAERAQEERAASATKSTDSAVGAAAAEQELDREPRTLTPRQAREWLVGSFVRDAGGVDLDGELVGWRDGAGERGTVVVMTSVTCPLCRKFAPAIARAEETWSERGFGFVHVGVGGIDALAALREHAGAQGLEGLVLSDTRGQIAAAFDVRTTTEVFVVDARGTLRYRGALSDQYGIGLARSAPLHDWLGLALAALVDGDEPRTVATTAPGCLVERDAPTQDAVERGETITYARHVSRLIQNNCLECHRTGGVAPFALDSYAAVERRASMLRAVIDLGTMPPWSAATDDAHALEFANDRSLLEREVRALGAWIEAGKPEGDARELPLPPRFDPDGWTLGRPDAVYTLPEPIAVPAEGTVSYQYVPVPTGLERDRWVDGIEVLPGAAEVVHHVLVWAMPAEAFEGGRFQRWDLLDERRGFFTAWAPGLEPADYPEGHAKFMPKGTVLLLELHYTPNGREVLDRTSVGVRFADDGPDWQPSRVVRSVGISNRSIAIPPGAPAHEERSAAVVLRDMDLLAFMPHMHLRGSAFRYALQEEDGTQRTLLDVPRFDFNWQTRYDLADPVRLERRDVLHVEAVFDNSAENFANPDPRRRVGWGQQTEDEMLIGFIEYVLVTEDLALDPTDALLLTFEPRTMEQLRTIAAEHGGRVPRSALHRRFHATFDQVDTDGDGFVGPDELPLLSAR